MLNNVLSLENQLETVKQAKTFLHGISTENYQLSLTPHFSSSAGVHMRHILDHYLALMDGLSHGLVNYNKRHRFSEAETCPQSALQQWQEIERWLTDSSQLSADLPLTVISETSINTTENSQAESTLARELLFVASHAIHHFSLLAVINSLLGDKVEENFGIAPCTASYLRQQA